MELQMGLNLMPHYLLGAGFQSISTLLNFFFIKDRADKTDIKKVPTFKNQLEARSSYFP